MITPDDLFVTMRGLINRGYVSAEEVAKKTGLHQSVVDEALISAEAQRLVFKHAKIEAYLLSPWGVLEVEQDSLRKIVEFNNGGQEISPWE